MVSGDFTIREATGADIPESLFALVRVARVRGTRHRARMARRLARYARGPLLYAPQLDPAGPDPSGEVRFEPRCPAEPYSKDIPTRCGQIENASDGDGR